jgi:hypothetical protein
MSAKCPILLAVLACLAVSACQRGAEPPLGLAEECHDAGVICTWAGTGRAAFEGDGHALLESSLYWPVDVTFASDGTAYVLDWNNHRVRHLVDGALQTVIGTDFVGDGDPATADLMAPGVPGTDVSLNHPTQLHELSDGTFLLLAWHNHKLRHYDPTTGLVYVLCGRGAGFAGDGETLDTVLLNQPVSGVLSPGGSFFLLDQRNQRIRRLSEDLVFETVAGTGTPGFSGDGGAPLDAQFNFPMGSNPPPAGGITLDEQGRLYVADTLNHRIRRIDFDADTIETVVGDGQARFGGDDGPAVEASLNNPREILIGPDGRLYVADEWNNRVRVVDLVDGTIATLAGDGEARFAGDGGPAEEASLNRPAGLAFDEDGVLYVSDSYNHRIRRIPLPTE